MSGVIMKQRMMERTESESEMVVNQLEYDDDSYTSTVLSQLYKMHKQDQFCDATLIIGDHESCIHRAVLAAASSYFYELFEKGEEEGKRNQGIFKLKDVRWEEFRYLLDYIYTGRLEVPDDQVKAVYRLSQDLRIQSATEACAQYLISCLTPDNCLAVTLHWELPTYRQVKGIRIFAADESFRDQVNRYISNNIREVTISKKFYGLSRVSLEIVVPDELQVNRASNEEILPQILVWLKTKMAANKNKVDRLTEDMIVLYLNSENLLTDCDDIDDEVLQENEIVQDYKKLTRRKQSGKTPTKDLTAPQSPEGAGTPNYMKFSINPERPTVDQEWSIVASYKTKARSYMVIAMLSSNLVTISVHYRPAIANGSGNEDPDSPVHKSSSSSDMFPNVDDTEVLKAMSVNRCAFGLKAIDGKMYACGGYDRGECLKSAEVYNFNTNKWSNIADMRSARGRFSIAVHDGKIYACGGSNGNHDMKTLECYDPMEDKWHIVTEVLRAKASPGFTALQDKLYVLGGCIGQSIESSCEVFDLQTRTWNSIAPMRIPRYQVAVTVFRNKIYAIGGTNGWKCLNEVEVYDPQTNEWSLMSNLNIGRRGAGVDIYKGKIYTVGGNDGTSALNSTEIYDPETHTWLLGSSLMTHRANCGVAVYHDMLFAVGGFNGKKFLNTMECLDLSRTEYWSNDIRGTSDEESDSASVKSAGPTENGVANDGSNTMDQGDCNRNQNKNVISVSQNKLAGVETKHGQACNGEVKQDRAGGSQS